ncbi:MAG: DUF2961 domain-containing protein [Armatimonas sp.]
MPNPISFESLLQEMVDTDSIARWPQAEFTCHQVSSYDRATVAPDKPGWFANNDFNNYLRTESNSGRTEQVLMDAAGPGVIVRFWLTAGGEKDGVLRIYLDGETTPTISFHGFDLLRGNLPGVDAPLLHPHPGYSAKSGGNNLYLPIPYARHCKVTWEEKSQGQRYYHINYRTYAAGTEITTFTLPQLQAARGLIQTTNRTLEAPPKPAQGKAFQLKKALMAGNQAALDLPAGSNAIQTLELKLEPKGNAELERTLRSVIIELSFDGKTTAWCPATDFFGSGVGINALQSWYRTVSTDGTMTCRWVMPYQKSARVSLHNTGKTPVAATLKAIVSPWKWDERSMHFHATWHHEAGLHTPPLQDWNYVQIQGRGVYAGDTLALFNPVPTWYGEGDEKIWVDGESFPSHMGTGTEDYYGYSYAPKGIIQTPFANQVRVDEQRTQGWNVLTRTRQLDGIPFRKSLKVDIELISWRPTTLIYSATTYWYAFPGATTNLKPQPEAAALPVPTLAEVQAGSRKPGAIECESMTVVRKSGDFFVEPQDMEPWGSERWSGAHHLLVKAERVGDMVELEFPAPDSKPRQLVLYATQAKDYGLLRFRVNGMPCASAFDGYAPEVQPSEPFRLGVFRPDKGRFIIQVTVAGANPNATGPRYYLGLDCVVLEPAS